MVTDPSGDVIRVPGLPVAPDLIGASADVANGNITFDVQLAFGVLDRRITRVSVLLDVDQNGATGIRQLDGLGADYAVELDATTSQATISKANPGACAADRSCFDAVGSAPITIVGDSMQVTVPLSLLGNDDGRLSFQLNSNVFVQLAISTASDFMPDNNLPPGRVQ